MAEQKKMVEEITSMEEDFAKWYTDVVKKAELASYSCVRGCMVVRPYGTALWENIRDNLDRRFKALGHENVMMPLFIPESLLQKEKDHVEDVDNVIVAPTVPYGVCPYHLSFEGSINIGYEGLYMVLHGIMDSLMQHGAKRFVILNGHGGNTPSIDRAALEVYHKGGVCARSRRPKRS